MLGFFIDLWCNGNTSDFGSVVLGSNPGRSTMGSTGFDSKVN